MHQEISMDSAMITYVKIKRIVDLLFSLFVLLLFFPFSIIVALIIKIDTEGPIFFKQERVGKNLKTFKLYKFRTMTNEMRGVSRIVGRSEGVTCSGYYLRRFKVDELPQLINVLLGDMSLVGPRPSIYEQLKDMTEDEKCRYTVRPGMTGLAQVSGNIHLPWKQRFQYDLEYIKKMSFSNDLKIIIRTIKVVLFGEDKFTGRTLKLR